MLRTKHIPDSGTFNFYLIYLIMLKMGCHVRNNEQRNIETSEQPSSNHLLYICSIDVLSFHRTRARSRSHSLFYREKFRACRNEVKKNGSQQPTANQEPT